GNQDQALKGAALSGRIEQRRHLLAELLLLESMPVEMWLDGMSAAGAALLRAAGPVGAKFARRRHRASNFAADCRLQSLADAVVPQHARPRAVGHQNPRHLLLHRSISLPYATRSERARCGAIS